MKKRIALGLAATAVLAAIGLWFAGFLSSPPAPSEPPTRNVRPQPGTGGGQRELPRLSKTALARLLPAAPERGALDQTTLAALERMDDWLNQEDTALWPSVMVIQADRVLNTQRRTMQVAFAKPLSVRVTGLVAEAPVIELAGEDGARPLAVRLGAGGAGPVQPFADVTAVSNAFAAIERLRDVRLVATDEPLLDFLGVEGGVARIERTDVSPASPAGLAFRLFLFGPSQAVTLQTRGGEWQVQRIGSGP